MNVIKRDGKKAQFDESKIKACVIRSCQDLPSVDVDQIIYNARIKLFDGVKTTDIDKSLIKSARALIEQEPAYKKVAARLLLTTIIKEVFRENADSDAYELQYRKTFIVNLKRGIKHGIVSKELNKFNLTELSEYLKIERDDNFEYLGLQTVYDRYLIHIDQERLETPQAFWMRVAMGLAIKEENKTEWAKNFYDVLSTFTFMCSTPTLFNSGTVHNQLSSCFLSTFEDSINGIFDGLHQEALKSKFAGGLGMDLTPFRPQGNDIVGTNGQTQGAVYFWKLYNDMLIAVNQGGKRKGAGCGYLETWHGEINEFLDLRKNTGEERKRTHDMNTANWIPDLFMQQVKKSGDWYLFSPYECPKLHETFGKEFAAEYAECIKRGKAGELKTFKKVEAKELWKKMLRMIFETGHPWITFKDPSNIRYSNQHVGVVHSSNLCTEILLHTKHTTYKDDGTRRIKEYGETAVCNLGSINLKAHVDKDGIQWTKLSNTIEIGMRILDNVVDINFYPTEEARKSNTTHRPVGMGSMGWHDMWYALDINIDSSKAVELAGELYEYISLNTILASSKLAKERGKYSTYEGSLWSQGIFPVDTHVEVCKIRGTSSKVKSSFGDVETKTVRQHVAAYGMRNSNTMAIAPTATISSIVGCSQSIEPYYNNIFVYSTLSGDFTMVNDAFITDMKKLNAWNMDALDNLKACNGDLTVYEFPKNVNKDERARLKLKYKTAFQQDQFKLIDATAARQVWIDQGQSLNLYNDQTSMKFLNDLYMHAWESGLKTTYYLRNKGASQIEKSNVKVSNVENITPVQEDIVMACSIDNPECESCQ
jgi:ribonucleoside-diphosphate reductase alpha chain